MIMASPKVGDICHVEADYFYGGVWEEYNQDELVCNYWKFFSEEQQIQLEHEDIDSDYSNDESENNPIPEEWLHE